MTRQITKDMLIGDILRLDQGTAHYFMDIGMHCLGCPSAQGETLEQACEVHNVDPDMLLERINQYLAKN